MDYNFSYILSTLAKQDLNNILEYLNNKSSKILNIRSEPKWSK